ncbi:nucleobase:cation symporter-2 family protein [Agilicoccus flavus]|uniref:nucleobase:cation symporter-2 family protein n=1 Tax=Agilicoccus flavus TaxID=2775968 RepID=UPI001CF65115|nr:nucleobase:cation symporter-2 family protein [Agilicoccus flavus]
MTHSAAATHRVDERLSPGATATFGVQHLLIMYAGSVAVPLAFGAALGLDQATIAMLINADLLIAGIITVVQSLGVRSVLGARLPIIGGATFVQVAPLIAIAHEHGLPAVWGCMLAGGLIGMALAYPFARIIRYFPPLVTGTVLVVVGVSLVSVAGGLIVGSVRTAPTYGDMGRIGLAALVLVVALAFVTLGRGFWSQAGLLVAIAAGVLVAWPMGLLDFGRVGGAHWFGVVRPFHFGAPTFPIAGVISCGIVMTVIFAETLASLMALSEITGKRLTRGDIARALAADGLSGVLGGIMNSFYDTVFNQNVGAVRTTRVHSRYVTALAGVLLVVLGLIPKMGAVVAALPGPVIGGAALMLFGTIAVVGIQTLRRAGLADSTNATIVAVSVGLGLLPKFSPGMFDRFPSWSTTILSDGVVLAAVSAFVLNLVFNHTWLALAPHRDESVRLAAANADAEEAHAAPAPVASFPAHA